MSRRRDVRNEKFAALLRPQQGGKRDAVFEQGRVPCLADRLGPRFGLRFSGLLEKASKGGLVRSGWGWVLILLKKTK